MARVKLDGFKCERCGHIWAPRNTEETPKVCPKCKSPYWDRARKTWKKFLKKDTKRGFL